MSTSGNGLAVAAGRQHQPGVVGQKLERPGRHLRRQRLQRRWFRHRRLFLAAHRVRQHRAGEACVEEQIDVLGGNSGQRRGKLAHRIGRSLEIGAARQHRIGSGKKAEVAAVACGIAMRGDVDDQPVVGAAAALVQEIRDPGLQLALGQPSVGAGAFDLEALRGEGRRDEVGFRLDASAGAAADRNRKCR